MQELQQSIPEQQRLVGASVCASAESCGYAINAGASRNLRIDDRAATGNPFLDCRGTVEGCSGAKSRHSRHSCYREMLPID